MMRDPRFGRMAMPNLTLNHCCCSLFIELNYLLHFFLFFFLAFMNMDVTLLHFELEFVV